VGILTPDELAEGSQEKQMREVIEDAYDFFSKYTIMTEGKQDERETRDEANDILQRMSKFISF